MDDVILEKMTRDPAGKILRCDECTVWTDGPVLAWCRVRQSPVPRHHRVAWPDATTHFDRQGRRFLAQFDSDPVIGFQMGDYSTLRFYFDGEAVKGPLVTSAVCTLLEA